ncbi:helix-turn-helix transcriptional regulator [Phenylobacterium sp.]|uniref:helix-turn-helix transcriptional regulator n=1 Tax=Phenylobacterium sp. TaxID=1871053 RepID=UPI00374C9873
MTDVSEDTAAPTRAPAERLQPDRVLRWRELKEFVGVSRTTWWRMVRAGTAPAARRISPGRVGWLQGEIATHQSCLAPSVETMKCE